MYIEVIALLDPVILDKSYFYLQLLIAAIYKYDQFDLLYLNLLYVTTKRKRNSQTKNDRLKKLFSNVLEAWKFLQIYVKCVNIRSCYMYSIEWLVNICLQKSLKTCSF